MCRLAVFASLFLYSIGAIPLASRPDIDGRIVGGSPAVITNYPYQVSLEYGLEHDCGGSIISPNWVLTAAHCAYERPVSSIRFRAGSTYQGTGGTIHPASQIVVHPNYGNHDYDVAVIKVSVPFKYSTSVQPISMSSVTLSTGTPVVVSGWGRLSSGGTFPSQLQQVQVNIVDFNECNRAYRLYGGITSRMFCAGVSTGGKDSCQGDSGGPLVANGKLSGVVSWGVGCGERSYPGVYADVTVLKSWVTSVTGVQ